MIRFSSPISILFLAVALLSLSACDSGGNNEEENTNTVADGRVEVNVSGDAEAEFDGYAYFYEATNPETSQTVFGIVLSNTNDATPDQQTRFIVIARESGRPNTGQHAFAQLEEDDELKPSDFVAIVSSAVSDGSVLGFYASNGGTLTIDRSSESSVAGSFEIDAVGVRLSEDGQSTEQVNVTVEGAFDANPSDTFYFPYAPN